MQNLTLLDTEDLSVCKDKLESFNLQLTWVGQSMSESHLVYQAQLQLKTSRYQKDVEALLVSNTAARTSFTTLSEFCTGLWTQTSRSFEETSVWGAGPVKSSEISDSLTSKSLKPLGIVASVKEEQSTTPSP
jgi:hypothetical protein